MKLETIDIDWLEDVTGGGGHTSLLGGAAAKEVAKWGARLHGYRFRPARAAVTPPAGQYLGERRHALDHLAPN